MKTIPEAINAILGTLQSNRLPGTNLSTLSTFQVDFKVEGNVRVSGCKTISGIRIDLIWWKCDMQEDEGKNICPFCQHRLWFWQKKGKYDVTNLISDKNSVSHKSCYLLLKNNQHIRVNVDRPRM